MNYYDYETTAEYNREQIKDEFKSSRLAKRTHNAHPYHPSRFTHLMYNFANWMIATGKRLRARYEIPQPTCSSTHTERFAH